MKCFKRLLAALVFLVLVCTTATAAPIWGTPAPLGEGTTTLTGFGNWAGNSSLSWDINQLSNGLFRYDYTFVHGGSGLSHLVLEFSASCQGDQMCMTNPTVGADGPRLYEANDQPNFEMPVDIFGTKFQFENGASPNTFSFTSNRAPVYGNIYARDGGNGFAYNQGLTVLDSPRINYFVARPDGASTVVPEPGTIGLTALAGIAFIAIRRRARKA